MHMINFFQENINIVLNEFFQEYTRKQLVTRNEEVINEEMDRRIKRIN